MQPVAQIFQLTEGYVLATEQHSIACTTLASLNRAIRAVFSVPEAGRPPAPASAGNVVPFARPGQAPAVSLAEAMPTLPAAPPPPPPQPPAPDVDPLAASAGPLVAPQHLPTDQLRNLYNLADALYRGLLQRPDVQHNLAKYVPNLDPHTFELFYQEYAADRRSDED